MPSTREPAWTHPYVVPLLISCSAGLLCLSAVAAGAEPAGFLLRLREAHPGWHTDTALFCGLMAALFSVPMLRIHPGRRRPPAGGIVPPPPGTLDPLTGLRTRAAFHQAVTALLESGQTGVLLVLDVDRFRELRDTHGSGPCDVLLCDFAFRLAALAPPGAITARLHGDEFALLAEGLDGADLAREAALILRGLSAPFELAGQRVSLSVSVGAALLPRDGASFETGLRAALLALQSAKQAGGALWRRFEPALGAAAQARGTLRTELRAALSAGHVLPFYQPIVNLTDGTVVGFEVLARWNHPQLGLLLPDRFIKMAEAQLLCAELSLCLLRQVVMDAKTWPAHWTFAFNAAPSQLRELIACMRDPSCLPPDMLDPRRIELELTENTMIEDLGLARKVVVGMHRVGAKVVLDDFGTGYANFLRLRDIAFDRIKIDRGFVKDLLANARTEACVSAMLSLARDLRVQVTAEGVEDRATADRLRDMGCDRAQGYHFSPPVPAAQVAAFAGNRWLAAA